MKLITVYTPTYNRAFCIHQVYESLLSQTVQDFEWLIIDDGSTDDTEAIVLKWIAAKTIDIRYIKQINKGMLGAHNTAHAMITTELAMCIDSDDFMPNAAIEKISTIWPTYRTDEKIAGIVGLDCYKDGKIIGDSFETDAIIIKYKDVTKVIGDKKYIYRSSVLKEFGPYPVVEGEMFPAQGYLYRKIDSKYHLVALNEIFCVVEYLPDGNSHNKISSYLKNPKGFMIHRILMMETSETLKDKVRNAIHYVSSCLIAKEGSKIFFNKFFYMTLPAMPLGILLFFYLKYKKDGAVNKKLNT
jgi:glycosyltransferase involved in cell wall biosynthesis